ncbi:hypothetical protein EYF80_038858 [Liparis tanakae]|uniref:Uncharacterized protein n=1 Tax=Liparis tanakae TaxID=230148 RepID=A0A4Z2GCS2_9TELE|nr:hypothetical protein EYF80_038858 [Liparis tanakae]
MRGTLQRTAASSTCSQSSAVMFLKGQFQMDLSWPKHFTSFMLQICAQPSLCFTSTTPSVTGGFFLDEATTGRRRTSSILFSST